MTQRPPRHAGMPAPNATETESGVSLGRIYAIRIVYILFFIPGTVIVWNGLFDHEPTARGVFASMLGAMFLLSFLVIRYPLQMLPILMLEAFWKLLWLVFFGAPQWLAGAITPQLHRDLLSVGGGPILFGLLIPWPYVWRYYVRQPGDRWR